MARVLFVWLGLSAALAALIGSGAGSAVVDDNARVAVAGAVAFVTASGCATSRWIDGLRRGRIIADNDGSAWGLWRRTLPAGFLSAVAAAVVAFALVRHVPRGLLHLVGGVVGVIVAAALPHARLTRPARHGRVAWWLQGAAPPALLAGLVGALVGVNRFAGVDAVTPAELARSLAGTSLADALLGLGGFARAFAEVKAGVVVVLEPPPRRRLPGPIFVGLALAAACIVVGPWMLPTLSGSVVVAVKIVHGVVVGGLLSLLGALAGHRVAVQGTGA